MDKNTQAARAEQARNMAAARTPLEAYWAGSIGESVRLSVKHGAVRTVRAGRRTAAQVLNSIAR